MKNEIIEAAERAGISKIGFCRAEEYSVAAKALPPPPLLASQNIAARENPQLTLPGAESIIVCLFNYYSGAQKGNISRYARGADYHSVVLRKMSAIVECLEQNGCRGIAFADTGDLNERLLVRLSGLGFPGINGCMINDDLGSYFFVGYILTDCKITPNKPQNGTCLGCGRCKKDCPLGAIGDAGIDESRCLSYITQKKGELTEAEKEAMAKSGMIWGCDICQEVCPHNSVVKITDIPEFRDNLICELIVPEDISGREFKRRYGGRAFAWRGKNVLIRNQKIAYK